MSDRPTRKARALVVRDAFLSKLPELRSHWERLSNGDRLLVTEIGRFMVYYRSPFSAPSFGRTGDDPAPSYAAAMLRQSHGGNRAYGLDIYRHGKKLMNLEWDDESSRVDLVSFRQGDWDIELFGPPGTTTVH